MERETLVPVHQALVPFHGHKVLSVHLPDNHVAASHNALCGMLNLDRIGQMQRIRRDQEIADQLVLARVETTRGPRPMDVLIVDAIPRWLLGINFNMLAPEKRQLVIALQVEAVKVLYGYFFKTDIGQAGQPAPEEPTANTARPTRKRRQAPPWELIYRGLEMLATGMEELELEHQAMSSQIDTLKGQMAEMQQWREQSGSAGPAPQRARGLSMDHLIQLTVLAEALRSQTGEPIKVIYADLSRAFGVEEVNDIPDAGWQTALSWLWQRGQQ